MTSTSAKTYNHSDALDVPLLPQEESNPQQVTVEPSASKAIVALAVTAVPLLSPYFLCHFLWGQSGHEPPTPTPPLLMLCWTIAITLVLVFQFTSHFTERSMFQVLVNYAVASLLVISSFSISDKAFTFVIISSQELLLMVCQSTTAVLMTYSLAAVTWGLLSGVGGQFLVSLALRKDAERENPMIDDTLLPVVWYLLSVALIVTGCFPWRWVVQNDQVFARTKPVFLVAAITGMCGFSWVKQGPFAFFMLECSMKAYALMLWYSAQHRWSEEDRRDNEKTSSKKVILLV